MANKINFKKKTLDELPLSPHGQRIEFFDEQQQNLIIRVSHLNKVFYVRRKVATQDQKIRLGPYPEISIEQARKKALAVLTEFAEGRHPKQVAKTIKGEPTVGELFANYVDGHARHHCVRLKDMQRDFDRYLSDWKDRRHIEIKRSDVQLRVTKVLKEHGPGAANHMIILMRAAMNWNLRNETISGDNPWGTVKQMRIHPRERFLQPDEMGRFFKALEHIKDRTIRDYVLISLYTGARKANVLAMRWDQIDFNLQLWRIPGTSSKNKESLVVPLTSSAIALLKTRKDEVDGAWVFPGKKEGCHLVEPKKAWYKLLESAKISDLRLHDLRRTLASYMAMGNQSLQMIAKALGHKTIAATQIYSRLMADPVRDAMEKAQTDMHNVVASAGGHSNQ